MQPPATLRSCGIVNEGEVAGGLGGVYLPLVHAEVHADVIDGAFLPCTVNLAVILTIPCQFLPS